MGKKRNKRINLERRINKWGKRRKLNEEREEGEEREELYWEIEGLYWKMKALSGESINEEREWIRGIKGIQLSP